MSKTTLATGNAQTVKKWSEYVFRESRKDSFASKFMGGDNALIKEFTDLSKDKGDVLNIPFIQRMTSAGVTSGSTLVGAEDSLTFANFQATLEQYRNAVRDDGAMSRKRAGFDLPAESQAALKVWGSEKMDSLIFSAGQTSLRSIFYQQSSVIKVTATSSTATAALTTSDIINPKLIDSVKTFAKTGGNRSQSPIAPIKVNGGDYWILLVHPDVGNDLRQDSTWNQANREAMNRGENNPIFQNALGIWGGVVVYEHENIAIYTNGGSGSNVPYATCMLGGAGALSWAWGQREQIVYDTFDYENEQGWAWGMIASAGKPNFTFVSAAGSNTKDYGMIGVDVARTQVSDLTFS